MLSRHGLERYEFVMFFFFFWCITKYASCVSISAGAQWDDIGMHGFQQDIVQGRAWPSLGSSCVTLHVFDTSVTESTLHCGSGPYTVTLYAALCPWTVWLRSAIGLDCDG